MKSNELIESLSLLELNQIDAAKLLGVNSRTIRRWIKEDIEIPVPVEQALRAWQKLKEFGFPWRPDSLSLVEGKTLQMNTRKGLDIELSELLYRVEERNGPSTIWKIDLAKKIATYGDIEVSFYVLQDGGFSPSFYTRKDIKPDIKRDFQLLDDAYYCIAKKLSLKR